MDTELLIFLIIFMGIAFLITSHAKDSHGNKYGLKKMAKLWVYAVCFLGLSFFSNSLIVQNREKAHTTYSYHSYFFVCRL